jgi:LuxR family maltose regulon positive regulatory protein
MIILTSKIVLPRRTRGLIARDRLERLVSQVQDHRISLLKAPPGYGKTTLGHAWADQLSIAGQHVAWLGLDAGDDEPARFAFYVTEAIRRALPGVGEASQELASTAAAYAPGDILAPLLNDLAELEEPLFFFIDDFQHLVSQPALHCLSLLINHAPPTLHIVLIGRTTPTVQLTAAAAYGEVFELGVPDLRFTLEETIALADKHKTEARQHRPEDVKLLHDASDGWVAALRVLLLSLTNQENPADHLQRIASGRRPIAALIADLVDGLPEDLATLLNQIALPERICASLVHAMTGVKAAQQRIEQIEAMQLFLSPLDEQGQWYAFHPLFREHLENRLRRTQAEALQTLHRSAGFWFASQGMHRNAVLHALAAGDIVQALNWIDACAMKLIESGDMLTLIGWERQLQQHEVAIPLRLRLALAWAHSLVMAGDEGHRLVSDIEATLDAEPERDPDGCLRQGCQALRVTLLSMDDLTEASGDLARQCLASHPQDPWLFATLSASLSYSLGRECRWAEMYAVAPYAALQTGETRYDLMQAYRMWIHAGAERTQGNLAEARTYVADALRLVSTRRSPSNTHSTPSSHAVIRSLSRCMTSDLLYLQNRIDEAGQHAAEAIEIVKIAGSLDAVRLAFCVAARVAAHNGNRHRARSLLDNAEIIANKRHWPRLTAVVLMERARLALMDGRVDEARGHENRLANMAKAPGNTTTLARDIRLNLIPLRGWLALQAGDANEALRQVSPFLEETHRLHLHLASAMLETIRSLALDMQGQRQQALQSLCQACEYVAGGGALRPILDIPLEQTRLQGLIDTALEQASVSQKEFLQQLSQAAPASLIPAEPVSVSAKLSTREYQIMQLVAEGGSNKEIGRALGVAPETVKYHLKNIFAKLGVDSRAEAAAMATRIGLTVHRTAGQMAH